jgi:hypothetical protein
MNQTRIKAFVRTWNKFRTDMAGKIKWATECGATPPNLLEVQESDFPGCMQWIRCALDHQLFDYHPHRLCFDRSVRNRARATRERLEAVMVDEGPAWTKVVSHQIHGSDPWFHVDLDVVFEDGAAGRQEFLCNMNRDDVWEHLKDGQNKKSARAFFASDLAESIAAECRSRAKKELSDRAKAAFRQAAAEAMSSGLDHGEVRTLVDEVLAESVMAS